MLCLLNSFFGLLAGAYNTFKIVKNTQPQISPNMLKYWVMYSLLTIFDLTIDPFISWLPFYDYAKLMVLLYMLTPQSNGATILFDSFASPFLKKQEQDFATKIWPKIRGNLLNTTDNIHSNVVQQCITQIDSKELERLSIDTEKTIEMLQMEKIRRRRKHDKDVIINAVGEQRDSI